MCIERRADGAHHATSRVKRIPRAAVMSACDFRAREERGEERGGGRLGCSEDSKKCRK